MVSTDFVLFVPLCGKTQTKALDLEYKSEAKAYLAWYLSREWLIESRISRDSSVSKSLQDLVRESSVEHCPEGIQLTKPVGITDPKISRRQRVRRDL